MELSNREKRKIIQKGKLFSYNFSELYDTNYHFYFLDGEWVRKIHVSNYDCNLRIWNNQKKEYERIAEDMTLRFFETKDYYLEYDVENFFKNGGII